MLCQKLIVGIIAGSDFLYIERERNFEIFSFILRCSSLFFQAGKYEYIDSDHWMYQFFKADIFFRMNLHKNALDQYERISEAGFTNMPHILNEIAACLNYLQG